MNTRIIRVKNCTDVESLKNFILLKLNLVDYKRDSIAEFEERLTGYIDRIKNLQLEVQLDRDTLEKDLKSIIANRKRQRPYPEDFRSHPLNRWFWDTTPMKTEKEKAEEHAEIERTFQDQLVMVNGFLDRLQQLREGQIIIKELRRSGDR